MSTPTCTTWNKKLVILVSIAIVNPRHMREGYGTWFVIHSFIHSLSIVLQRSAITSTRRLRYEQAKHDNGLQCDAWILLKCFRSRDMTGSP